MKTLIEYADKMADGIGAAQKIIWLKEDLQLAKTCREIRVQLLSHLRNNEIFSPKLTACFDGIIPYAISEKNEPALVVTIKKTINALYADEEGFSALENINVRDDRYWAGIANDYRKVLQDKIPQFYSVIKLVNEASADAQTILGPQMGNLWPKFAILSQNIAHYMPSNPRDAAAKTLGSVVNVLPSNMNTASQALEGFCKLFFELPAHLENLQGLVATGASGLVVKSTTSVEGYQAMMLKKANETKKNFETLIATNYHSLALPNYILTLKQLVDHSVALVSSTAPLTKQAYLDAADHLNKIRHEIMPELVIELEKVEESLCLKPNVLVGPAITQMECYYQQLADHVQNFSNLAGVIDENLDKKIIIETEKAVNIIHEK